MKKLVNLVLLLSLALTSCQKENELTITLHLNGGTINNSETLKLSLKQFKKLDKYPIFNGKIFSSYYFDAYFTYRYDGNLDITESIDLYAKYYDDIFDYELVNGTYTIKKVEESTYNIVTVPDYIENKKVDTLKKESLRNIEAKQVILKSIETIEKDAFLNSEINYLEISDSIKKIEYGAFRNVKQLKAVNIKENPYYSAVNNVILERLEDDNRIIIGNYGYDKSMFNEEIVSTVNVVGIAPYSYSNIYIYDKDVSTKGFTYYVPSTMTEVGESAFENCKVYCYNDDEKIKVQLGTFFFRHMRKIGKNAFKDSSLSIVKYEINKIDDDTYVPCSSGIEEFEEGAFQNLDDITRIIIPKTLKKIGLNCFYDCDNLKEVFYEGTKEEYEKIEIAAGNDVILNARTRFYSRNEAKGCWYYHCSKGAKAPYLGTIMLYDE